MRFKPTANAREPVRKAGSGKGRSWPRRALLFMVWAVTAFYLSVTVLLAMFRWVDPPITAVRLERRIEAISRPGKYIERWEPVPLSQISPHLRHAVIAAEDGNFYRHWGFDFDQIEIAVKEDWMERGRLRGASTISQQLVKNLFLSTRGSFVRKGIEVTLTPLAEVLLGKERILEIYLNQVEWGPGVFGAEAAAEFHYRASARGLSRQQAIRLAAVLPSPLRRRPGRMNRYSAIIDERMRAHGW